MATKKQKVIIGFLMLMVTSTAIYIALVDQPVRMRVDDDAATFYIFNENNRWEIAGMEYNRLFNGSTLQYRDLQSGIVRTYETDGNWTRIVRSTSYKNGAKIIDVWEYLNNVSILELFPVMHYVTILNGTNLFYRITWDELEETGDRRKLDGETHVKFGDGMDVEVEPGYRWCWVGWPYGNDSMSCQYDVDSDYEMFKFRFFDPVYTVKANAFVSAADMNDTIAEGNCTHLSITNTGIYANLVSYYPFDCDRVNTENTTIYDFSANQYDGTSIQSAYYTNNNLSVNSTGCVFGNCGHFDGDNDRVYLGDNDVVDGLYNFTVCAWARASTAASVNHFIFGQYSNPYIFRMWWDSQERLVLDVRNSTGNTKTALSATGVFTDFAWHHACGVYNGTNVLVYYDSVIGPTQPAHQGAVNSGNEPLILGASKNSNPTYDYGWPGELDEMMIFNRSLTTAEIVELYLNQTNRFKESGTFNYVNHSVLGGLTPGFNTVNVSTEMENLSGSAIELKIGYYAGGWSYTAGQNITNHTNYTFTVSSSTTNLTLNYTFYAGNISTSWYSPLLFPAQAGDIVIVTETTGGGGDTCDCSSIQAGNVVNCSENCNISACDAMGQRIVIYGAGHVPVVGDITNWTSVHIEGLGATDPNRCTVTCDGGCFIR